MAGKLSTLCNLIIVTCALSFAGCSKSGGSSEKSKPELIAASTWKFSSAGIDLDGNGTIDQQAPATLAQPCLTDNSITFKADKTGSIDEGATKCDASTPQVSPFTWALSDNDTQLTLSTPILAGFGSDAKIVELTATKFVLSRTISYSGLPIPVVVILVH